MIRECVFQLLAIPAELVSGHKVSTETQRKRVLVSIHPNGGQGVDIDNQNSLPLLGYLDFIALLCVLGKPDPNWKNVINGKSIVVARRIYLKNEKDNSPRPT